MTTDWDVMDFGVDPSYPYRNDRRVPILRLEEEGPSRGRRRRRLVETDDERLMQGYVKKLKTFLPIVRGDIINVELDAAAGSSSQSPGCRSPYEISELRLDLNTRQSDFTVREKDSTDVHEWLMNDAFCIRKSKKHDVIVFREKRIMGLPRGHTFQLGLLTKFYIENSVLDFDSLTVNISEDVRLPDALFSREMIIRKLTLELPLMRIYLPPDVMDFLLRIRQSELKEVHIKCKDLAFFEMLQWKMFPNADVHATMPSLLYSPLSGFVPKRLTLKGMYAPLLKNEFYQIVEQYCNPSKKGKTFVTEVRSRPYAEVYFFEVINELIQKEGWSFNTFDNQIAASKNLGDGSEVLVYFNLDSRDYVIENGPIKSRVCTLTCPLLEQVDEISMMTYSERVQLRERICWEPLVHYNYDSIIVNFDTPEVVLDGCELPNIEAKLDARNALKELLKNPKSRVKKLKIIGEYFLFRAIPTIQVSELWIHGDKVFADNFFDPFKDTLRYTLVLSTREIVNEARFMIDRAESCVVLAEIYAEAEDNVEHMEEMVDETEGNVEGSEDNADEKKEDGADPQPESKPEPEMEIDSEPELDDSDINYESIELNFDKAVFKLNGETMPDIKTSYDVYKKMANLALENLVIRELKITGYYPLFQRVQKFKTLELWLDGQGVYPVTFFEPLKGIRLKKLTVSSQLIVTIDKELVARAKEFVVFEDSGGGQKEKETDDDDEPKAKRAKLDDFVLNESSPEPNADGDDDDDDGEPKLKRRRLSIRRSVSKVSASSRPVSPAMSTPLRFPTPEPDFRVQTPISDRNFKYDFELEWALSESALTHKKESKEKEKEEKKKKEKPVHYLSKNFVPQPLFPIPINGFPGTSHSSAWAIYDPIDHYNLSRYEEATDIGPRTPWYPYRTPTPTEPYVPIAPFDMKKYEDEFHQLQIHEDRPVRKAAPIDASDDSDDDDQPGPSGS